MAFRRPANFMPLINSKKEHGSAALEFCLSSLIWLPLLLGTTVFGINLIHAMQLSQLSRDTGHMYAYGIDFTQPQNVPLLTRLSSTLNIKQYDGDGAVVLSKITLLTDSDCTSCANNGKYVFTSLYVFGNPAYAQTKLGNPGSYLLRKTPITVKEYQTDSALVADKFSSYLKFLPNQQGQYAFVSEVSINTQALAWSDFSNTGSYARTIF